MEREKLNLKSKSNNQECANKNGESFYRNRNTVTKRSIPCDHAPSDANTNLFANKIERRTTRRLHQRTCMSGTDRPTDRQREGHL